MKPYEVVYLDQNTPSWEEFRKAGIGASDAPIIMRASPWRTPLQLYNEKKGIVNYVPNPFVTQRGHENEPKARARYQLLHNVDMPPLVVKSTQYPFMRASLDGFNEEIGRVLEIKCVNPQDHGLAKLGVVPEKYIYQLEHQMLVTGAKEVHYFSYFKDPRTKIVTTYLVAYQSDPEKREELRKALIAFWWRLENNEPPPLSLKDRVELDSPEAIRVADELWALKRKRDALKRELKHVEGAIKDKKEEIGYMHEHCAISCKGVQVTAVQKRNHKDHHLQLQFRKPLVPST